MCYSFPTSSSLAEKMEKQGSFVLDYCTNAVITEIRPAKPLTWHLNIVVVEDQPQGEEVVDFEVGCELTIDPGGIGQQEHGFHGHEEGSAGRETREDDAGSTGRHHLLRCGRTRWTEPRWNTIARSAEADTRRRTADRPRNRTIDPRVRSGSTNVTPSLCCQSTISRNFVINAGSTGHWYPLGDRRRIRVHQVLP